MRIQGSVPKTPAQPCLFKLFAHFLSFPPSLGAPGEEEPRGSCPRLASGLAVRLAKLCGTLALRGGLKRSCLVLRPKVRQRANDALERAPLHATYAVCAKHVGRGVWNAEDGHHISRLVAELRLLLAIRLQDLRIL